MKNLKILLFGLVFLTVLNSCENDDHIIINPQAETGELTFTLNQTRYSNYTYVLEEKNNDLSMDALKCSQPDYGFTAAVTYYVQASFTEDMTEYTELATPVQGETVDINVKGSIERSHPVSTGAIGSAISFDPTRPVHQSYPGDVGLGYYVWMDDSGKPRSLAASLTSGSQIGSRDLQSHHPQT